MAAKKVSHIVRRPGLRNEDPHIDIPVAEDLVSQPGIPTKQSDVDYYSLSPRIYHCVRFFVHLICYMIPNLII